MDNLTDLINMGGYAIGAAGVAYSALMLSAFLTQFERRIGSEKELNLVIKQEAEKLGIQNKLISGILREGSPRDNHIARSFSIGLSYSQVKIVPYEENNPDVRKVYIVEIGKSAATRGVVRHELKHVKSHLDGRHGKLGRLVRYALHDEPSAILYSLTGIEIDK